MGKGRAFAAAALAWSLLALLAAPVVAEVFNGVDFPQGAASFADEVVTAMRGSGGATSGSPNKVLGPPDGPGGSLNNHSFSLGNGGTITIRFTNNVLTGSGTPAADLYIFETGTAQEFVTVEVSADGVSFTSCGQTFGQTGNIDVDACGFGPSDQLFFVRVTDIASD
jgi:hypothetical protein